MRAVPLGEPGLSFRYERTFGQPLVPYLVDNAHLFRPGGVATDAKGNVYITENNGQRMIKYTSEGVFLMAVGQAGVSLADDSGRLGWPNHLLVDGDGNIWIAESASRVSTWNSSGEYVSQLGETWNCNSDNDHVCWPQGIATDGAGTFFVGDTGNHRVQVFDTDGSCTATLGTTGSCGTANNQFCTPRGVAVDDKGRIYVADEENHRVQIYDDKRNYLTTLGTTGTCGSGNNQLCQPYDVEIDRNGKVYVMDSGNNRVQIFSAYPTLSHEATLGVSNEWGDDNDHFGWATAVAVDRKGNIFVADTGSHRVQMFDSNRTYVRTFGVTSVPYLTDNLHYTQPRDVAIDPSGDIIIVESNGQRVIKLNPQGIPQFTIGSPGKNGRGEDRFCWPQGVVTDAASRIYVADRCNNRIQIYSSAGAYLATVGGEWGTGNNQFKDPQGVFVSANGYIYVADTWNHRVQVYDDKRFYVATLGMTGVAGSDNQHFNGPQGVAVDDAGSIFVADTDNLRVQKCSLTGACTTFAGVTGEQGDDFGHFRHPTDVAVDKAGRVLVADEWNARIQVFDQKGAYLTTIGGSYGQRSGETQNPTGVGLDATGSLYIADSENHRVQKFAPGVPGWRQSNLNGFGELANSRVLSLAPFGWQLYAGTHNWAGAQLWRFGSQWTAVMTGGFGSEANEGINDLFEFKGKLYAGTWNWADTAEGTLGGEIWRSNDGQTWNQVVSGGFGDLKNGEVFLFAEFKDNLYATTWSYSENQGGEIWRSQTGNQGDWTRVMSNGFGDPDNLVASAVVFDGYLFAGTYNWDAGTMSSAGGSVWRTDNGTSWVQVSASGFGDKSNLYVRALAVFDNALYAATGNWDPSTGTSSGGQIWRCTAASGCDKASDWQQVIGDGFGNTNNSAVGLYVSGRALYAPVYNGTTGMEVWRTLEGTNWLQMGSAGFGDSNNGGPYWNNSLTTFENHLYIGTQNWDNGGEVWLMLDRALLPLATRNYK